MSRFEEASSTVHEQVRNIVNDSFPDLQAAGIKVLFDLKKRKKGDKYVIGRLKKANEMEKFLTSDMENPEGFDYFMYLDKNIFTNISKDDQTRLIRHELCHALVDDEAKDPYKIQGHEVEDFYSEIEHNKDDPRWMERMAQVAESIYDKE